MVVRLALGPASEKHLKKYRDYSLVGDPTQNRPASLSQVRLETEDIQPEPVSGAIASDETRDKPGEQDTQEDQARLR